MNLSKCNLFFFPCISIFSRPLVSVPKMDTAAPTTSRCRAGTPLSQWLILALSPIVLRGINRLSFILWLNISVCHPVTRGLEVVNIYSIMYIYKDIYIYIYIYSQRSYFDSICIQRSATTLKPLTAHVNYAGNGRSAAIKTSRCRQRELAALHHRSAAR